MASTSTAAARRPRPPSKLDVQFSDRCVMYGHACVHLQAQESSARKQDPSINLAHLNNLRCTILYIVVHN
jgi:hypothetical protein